MVCIRQQKFTENDGGDRMQKKKKTTKKTTKNKQTQPAFRHWISSPKFFEDLDLDSQGLL